MEKNGVMVILKKQGWQVNKGMFGTYESLFSSDIKDDFRTSIMIDFNPDTDTYKAVMFLTRISDDKHIRGEGNLIVKDNGFVVTSKGEISFKLNLSKTDRIAEKINKEIEKYISDFRESLSSKLSDLIENLR